MQKTCIIIPCYNEEHRLDTSEFLNFIPQNPYHFCFVNDGSTDDTSRLIKGIKKKAEEKVTLLELDVNSGKSEAIRQGFLKMADTGSFDIIGYLDADLATPLKEIHYLLRFFDEEYEVVIGSRVKRLGTQIHRKLPRHYMGRIFATLASAMLNIKAYDSQCGAKFFKQETTHFLFEEQFISKWIFDLEILYRLRSSKPHIYENKLIEVPLRKWSEQLDSKIRLVDILKVPIELFRIRN